jgi:Phosphatidate cytidylyltransferase, mitochondrial
MGQSGQRDLIQRLPQRVVERVSHALGVRHGDPSELTNALSERSSVQLRSALLTTISAIVFRASLNQSVKGLLTAGLGTSVRYVASKFSKAFYARRRVLPSAKGTSGETLRANSAMPKTRMHA